MCTNKGGGRGGSGGNMGSGEQLFNSTMPESVRGRINTADVVQRMDAYARFAKSQEENMKIWQTELPEMYNEFVENETEYAKLLDLVYSGKAADSQRARYSEVSDRRTALGNYIRSGESYLRDHGEFKLAEALEKKRKSKGIENRDLY